MRNGTVDEEERFPQTINMPLTKQESPSNKLPGRRFENPTEVVEQRPNSQCSKREKLIRVRTTRTT